MKLNRLGQDTGASPLGTMLNGVLIDARAATSACWLNDTTIAAQVNISGDDWEVLAFDVSDPAHPVARVLVNTPATEVRAGGDNWAIWLGVPNSSVLTNHGRLKVGTRTADISAEGVTAVCATQNLVGIDLYNPDGSRMQSTWPTTILRDVSPEGLDVRVWGRVLSWMDAQGLHALNLDSFTLYPLVARLEVINWAMAFLLSDGTLGLLERSSRLTFRRSDTSEGWVISTGKTFACDGMELGGALQAVWSATSGEVPSSRQAHTVVLSSDTMVELNTGADVIPPATFGPFNHSVSIAVFKDIDAPPVSDAEVVTNQSVQLTERPAWGVIDSLAGVRGPLVGIYTEGDPATDTTMAEAELRGTRVARCHDGPTVPVVPQSLRPWDQPWLECYLVVGETVPQSQARWLDNLKALLAAWGGDVGLVPMFYCGGGAPPNELFPIADVMQGLTALTSLVNLSSRIKTIAPFERNRANGIIAHPELQQAYAALIDAAGSKRPTYVPLPEDPMPLPKRLALSSVPLGTVTPVNFNEVATVNPQPDGQSFTLTWAPTDANGKIPQNPTTVLSVQTDGTLATRPAGTAGAFEVLRIVGQFIVFDANVTDGFSGPQVVRAFPFISLDK